MNDLGGRSRDRILSLIGLGTREDRDDGVLSPGDWKINADITKNRVWGRGSSCWGLWE